MGKLKKGRKNNKKSNPLGNSNKPAAGQVAKDENTRTNKILPLIQKLSSSSSNERSMAISAISVLCEDEKLRKLLLKEKLIAIIMEQLLNDSNDEIVVESFGLLRNLCIEEGYDTCKYIWRSNIWVTILASIKKAEDSFKALDDPERKSKIDKSKQALLFDFSDNLISLTAVISASSDELYEEIFEKIDPVLNFVLNLINWNVNDAALKISMRLFASLLNFLNEFGNESNEFIHKLINTSSFNLEALIGFNEKVPLNNLSKIYIEGIKFHVYEAVNKTNDKQTICFQILSNIMSNITKINLEEAKKNLEPLNNTEDGSESAEDSKIRNQARSDIQAIETSLDLLTSIMEYLSVNESNFKEPVQLKDEVLDLLLSLVYPSLIELLKYDDFKSRSITALNNLSWLFLSNQHIPTPWFEKTLQLWDLVSANLKDDPLEVQIDSINVLWAIMKTIGAHATSKINNELVDSLINKVHESKLDIELDEEIRNELIIRIVGLLGSIAMIIGNTEGTSIISEFILNLIQSSIKSSPRVVVEALDAIYDIFGDKEYPYDHEIFVQRDYLSKLKALQPEVSRMYKLIDKKKHLELKLKAEEANLNLGRFITYKQQERS